MAFQARIHRTAEVGQALAHLRAVAISSQRPDIADESKRLQTTSGQHQPEEPQARQARQAFDRSCQSVGLPQVAGASDRSECLTASRLSQDTISRATLSAGG